MDIDRTIYSDNETIILSKSNHITNYTFKMPGILVKCNLLQTTHLAISTKKNHETHIQYF